MNRVQIAPSKDHFLRGGKPFFYLADTVWSVFSNATVEEWIELLDYRKAQGFNALQISVLPVLHDASDTYQGVWPFERASDGSWNFAKPNPAFFDKAVAMVSAAVERGFVPVLVLLWGNYVKDTLFSQRDPSHIMPLAQVRPYAELVVKTFARFAPIYSISGDTNFLSDATIEYYRTALETVKAIDPLAITTFHLQPAIELPEPFVKSDHLDFYMYQAGHRLEQHDYNYLLAEAFLKYPVKRPIVNGEPSYEGHGHGNKYGRFDNFHVRKAFWQSVLAGAKAGFTYGAHGVWSWHRRGSAFTSEGWSKTPFDWRTALRFPGAWDVGYAKSLYEQFAMYDLVPRQDLLATEYPDIRAAASGSLDTIVVYVPYSVDVKLKVPLDRYELTMIELADRRVVAPDVAAPGDGAMVRMIEHNSDSLLIARRRP